MGEPFLSRWTALFGWSWIAIVSLSAFQSCFAEKPMDWKPAVERFEGVVREQLARQITPGFSVAWVVDGETVHEAGYRLADWEARTTATAETIYRAGSISKLFNAIAAMQLVDGELLDLDAPIQHSLPEFAIVVPWEDSGPITIRQLLCHRSGMIREAPRGGYLDPSQPSVAETVKSVAPAVLVNRPNTKTRYSNVGPTIVGRAIEVKTGVSFEEYQARHVLGPLGMKNSAWRMNDRLRPQLAKGRMRVARSDGSFAVEAAPSFELGTIPAGNLYTTAGDLAKFAAFLMSADGDAQPDPRILAPGTLAKMFTPQLIEGPIGFGLGFSVNEYHGHKTVSHSGAVYGFSTSMIVLPKERIAAVVLSNEDIASGPVKRLMEASLDLLLEAAHGEKATAPLAPVEVPRDSLAELVGEYESQSLWAKIEVNGSSLRMNLSTQPLELTPAGGLKFLAEGRVMAHEPVEFLRYENGKVDRFRLLGKEYWRVDPKKSLEAPAEWKDYVGMYGPKFIPLLVSIKRGHLFALAENEFDYRLTPMNRVTFLMPPGMYDEEHVVFQRDGSGKVVGVVFANMVLPKFQ